MNNLRKIPLLDLGQEVDELWPQLAKAFENTVRSGFFINGPEVTTLEAEVAAYAGTRYAIGLNSGTDALVIGLRALGVGPGDEVITTAFSFFATSEAICQLGARPVFIDIDPATFNLDVHKLAAAITPKTKAIVPVHLFGQSLDMTAVMELAERHGLKVLEDVAQAFGADFQGKKLGALGHAGALSFFPSKNLGCYGDGGMLLTNDDKVADMTRMLRSHGSRVKYQNEAIGYNSRLDSLQAAILRIKLPQLDRWLQLRRVVAERYSKALAHTPGIVTPATASPHGQHSFYSYTIRVLNDRRDLVRKGLQERGIETMVYYPVPLPKLPVHQDLKSAICPHAEQAAREVLSLPIWPQMPEDKQDIVIAALRELMN